MVINVQNKTRSENIGFLTSINYMDKWFTPLGRVFKICNVYLHGFEDILML